MIDRKSTLYPDCKQAVIYARVSSAAQVAKGHGAASQETRCREFARMKGYEVLEVFRDEAVSGGLIQRPGMLELLAFVSKQKKKGGCIVLIDDISRLARDIKAHLDLRGAIAEAGGRLESPSIEFGEDSDSMLVENLLASVSQHQRQKNTEQTANRMRARLMNGYWTFSCPPGYRYEAAPGQGKILLRDEPLASIIAEAMNGFALGRFQTQAEVKRFFESFPDFPKTRYGTVTNEAVNRILTRVLYAGYLERPEWGVKLTKARHEPLVSLETFERIQQRLKEGAKAPARADISEHFPLRNFVLCGDCDRPLTACWARSKTGKKHPYYMCFNKECESNRKAIKRDEIEGAFETILRSAEPKAGRIDLFKALTAKAWNQYLDRGAAMRRLIRAKLDESEKQVSILLDRIVETSSSSVIARYEARIAELERKQAILQERLDSEGQPTRPFEQVFKLTLRFLATPCDNWKNGSLDAKRILLKLAFEHRPRYVRNSGFLNPEFALPFKALMGNGPGARVMAEREGYSLTAL